MSWKHRTRWTAAALAPAVTALALLAGCDGVVVTEPVGVQRYSNGDFEYAARNGVMKTEIVGNPFGGAAPNFAPRVIEYMQNANRGIPVKFALEPEGRGSAPYHVVMAFNPSRGSLARDACSQAGSLPTSPGTGSVFLFSVFCAGDVALSEASGSVANLSGPDDPRLRSLVRQVTYALIPGYDHKGVGASTF
jgi:hypothetical protein